MRWEHPLGFLRRPDNAEDHAHTENNDERHGEEQYQFPRANELSEDRSSGQHCSFG
jgi:hypothetical protein